MYAPGLQNSARGDSAMGWSKVAALGDTAIEMRFSRSGQFHRHIDTGQGPDEKVRLSGRHVRFLVRRRTWHELDEQHGEIRTDSET